MTACKSSFNRSWEVASRPSASGANAARTCGVTSSSSAWPACGWVQRRREAPPSGRGALDQPSVLHHPDQLSDRLRRGQHDAGQVGLADAGSLDEVQEHAELVRGKVEGGERRGKDAPQHLRRADHGQGRELVGVASAPSGALRVHGAQCKLPDRHQSPYTSAKELPDEPTHQRGAAPSPHRCPGLGCGGCRGRGHCVHDRGPAVLRVRPARPGGVRDERADHRAVRRRRRPDRPAAVGDHRRGSGRAGRHRCRRCTRRGPGHSDGLARRRGGRGARR